MPLVEAGRIAPLLIAEQEQLVHLLVVRGAT